MHLGNTSNRYMFPISLVVNLYWKIDHDFVFTFSAEATHWNLRMLLESSVKDLYNYWDKEHDKIAS